MTKKLPERSRFLSRVRLAALFFLLGSCLIFLAISSAAPEFKQKSSPLNTGRGAQSPDGVWTRVEEESASNAQSQRADIRSYRRVTLEASALSDILSAAPKEFSQAAAQNHSRLTLPSPDGSFITFAIAESPIMAPELAARFPEIKTYVGQGIDDPTATTRFDLTPQGFHAIVLSSQGTILIEPENRSDSTNYIAYFQKDVIVSESECDVASGEQEQQIASQAVSNQIRQIAPAVVAGTTLRTYRLAVAATAEYTQFYGGGTVSGGLSAVTTTINLVDAIYEREVAVRLTLIANEDSIIFTDSATDGYTSDNVNTMISENQARLESVIGAANYDVGHVFDGRAQPGGGFSWQGLASIGSVCVNAAKARGVDIFRSIGPSVLYAYYSASHELGHQFGATHTFNATTGLCGGQRSAFTAYEPSSGSTIMGYRLACSPDDLNSQDTYFHNISIEQIVNFTSGVTGNSCASVSATGNNPPLVDAGPIYTIPMGTPFTLTASGSDPDGDALTFCWEEFDLGAAGPPELDDGSRPIFRSFLPTTTPARIFPKLADVLLGSSPTGESLPSTTRTMNFRVTARDNRAGGGGVNSAATQVNVRSEAGPFTVTSPASASTSSTGSQLTVNWTVANTNLAPVNCANVKITLSTDGGTTFPIVLANNTPNDGAENVTLPGTPTSNARVKVEAVGNIFLNISRGFTITGSANTFPGIAGVSPDNGAPGATVVINGANFISPSAVSFNGVSASFTLNSTTQIVATVPNGATTGPVTVTTPSGTAASPGNFVVNIPSLQLNASAYSVSEAGPDVSITVTRTGDTSGLTTIGYTTGDSGSSANCSATGGAASSRCDYLATSGILSFAANETSKTILIPIVDDSYAEGSETFTFTLSNPAGAALGVAATATITIGDNDSVNGPNAIDQTSYFVRQHYIDFLNREPDAPGQAFWTGQITSCGANQTCVEANRVNVSGSFFLSIEFQQTGYLVERLYKTAFGSSTGTSTLNGTHSLAVPIVRLSEFLPDTQRISQGVIVGQGDWQTVLENNKQAFVSEFVQRSRFTGSFPTTLTPAQFVDALNGNAGNVLSASERATAINFFAGAGNTTNTAARAKALRQVAEDPDLVSAEFNRAFVLMQYFGYLRRNPNDPQDSDYTGYEFWLQKLNQFNGNFLDAEMVKAFLSSIEYRQRFGP
jgi:Metallo-peptidase family M12B Reprolysin-like/Calx-beta domain